LKENVSELSDEPNGTESERFLRDIGEESEVESLNGVGLEFGSVANESNEGRKDFLSNEVSSLSQTKKEPKFVRSHDPRVRER